MTSEASRPGRCRRQQQAGRTPVPGFACGPQSAITDLGIDNQVSSVTISLLCLNFTFSHFTLQE